MFDILPDDKVKNIVAQIVALYRLFEKGDYTATELRGRMNGFAGSIMQEVEAQKKHTLQQVIEWGNESCPHWVVTYPASKLESYQEKKHCDMCWAELKKEIEK